MKKLLISVISGSLLASAALASPCDKLALRINGPSNYQYTLSLSKGTLNKKETGEKSITDKMISPAGDVYKVYSGKGTKGDVEGSIHITNLDTNASLSYPFLFYSNANGSTCQTYPGRDYSEKDNFIVMVTSWSNSFIKFQVKEFK